MSNDIEYYEFTYKIPKYKIKPPLNFCKYYQIHKDEIIIELQAENKRLKEGLHKILDLNKRAINCESQKVTIKYLLKQYDLIYETLGELQPGLMKGDKE